MKNTYKKNNMKRQSLTRKKMKKRTNKKVKKDKKKKNKTIKLRQKGGGALDFIYWLLEKFLHLIMYGWFPRQPQNEQQNEQQNEPQKQSSNQLSDTIRNAHQQNKSQIETSGLEMIPHKDIVEWDPLKIDNPYKIGAKFTDALNFFVNHPCKYILSIHGTRKETELSELFKSYDEKEREGIINFLFDEYTDKKDIEYKVYSDKEKPIIIFYNVEDIKKLVKKMEEGVYNELILKYIMKYHKHKENEEEIKHHIDEYFKKVTAERLLELPFIWKPENNITDTIRVITTKILFGNVTCSGNPELDCGWRSEDEDHPVILD